MRTSVSIVRYAVVAGLGCVLAAGSARGQDAKSSEVVATPLELKWGPAPPVFEKGASMAVVSGDPSKAAPFVVRLKMPAGYKINPHFHPTDENVTVISGTFAVAMGDTFAAAGMKALPAGGFALLPAQMHHYAMAKVPTVVQVHAMGPFALTYVNPADDPSKRVAPVPAK
jgi:quercetin dioxygenase-like cupin family protein